MNIYIGNLPYTITEDALKQAFEEFGEVSSVKIIIDRITGKSKGFGFVDMPNDAEAEQAIAGINGKEFDGRTVIVNQARPQERRESSSRFSRKPRY